MERRIFKWTELQLDKLNKVQEILTELEDYKPLTLRQVFYQLVGKGYIDNTTSQYTMLSNLLKWARIDRLIPWGDIEDRVRVFSNGIGWPDRDDFVKDEFKGFLRGYKRDLMQTQEKFIEVWIEKDALSSIFNRSVLPYGISVVVCKGFSSVSFLNDFKERIEYNEGKAPVMLYFGDFDPSGVEMLEAMETTLNYELRITGINFKRVALLKEDIFKHKLPHSPFALKKSDTRTNKHIAKYGELAVELDALRPDVLEKRIKASIEQELDIEAFNREVEIHKSETKGLSELKDKVIDFITKKE